MSPTKPALFDGTSNICVTDPLGRDDFKQIKILATGEIQPDGDCNQISEIRTVRELKH